MAGPRFGRSRCGTENATAKYTFLGRILGKLWLEGIIVELPLAGFFLNALLRRPNTRTPWAVKGDGGRDGAADGYPTSRAHCPMAGHCGKWMISPRWTRPCITASCSSKTMRDRWKTSRWTSPRLWSVRARERREAVSCPC